MSYADFALNTIARVSLVLFGAALLTAALRRASASTRHAVWGLALASSLLLPLAAMLIPQFELPVLPQGSATIRFLPAGNPQDSAMRLDGGLETPAACLEPGRYAACAAAFAGGLWQTGRPWLQAGIVWIFGLIFLTVRLSAGMLSIWRLANTAVLPEGGGWQELIKELAATFAIRRPVRLLFSEAQLSPMTWGVFRHTILLPVSAAQWPEERRRLVLAHELAHVKRNDGLLQILVQLGCSVYWFNPLIWYAGHRLRIERERACDDQVLSLGTAAADYADHLVQIVRGLRARHSLSCAAVSMAQPSQLETRVVSILDSRAQRRRLSRPAAACLCLAATLVTVSMAAVGVTAAVPLPPVFVITTKIAPAAAAARPAPAPAGARFAAASPQKTRIGDAGVKAVSTVVPPQVVEFVPPVYTDEALRARIEGIVTLEAAVDIQGKVTVLRVVKDLGYGLDQKAIAAVLGWKFSPGLQNGVAVRAVTQVDVAFKLPKEWLGKEDPDKGTANLRLGPGITPPAIISRLEPQYSDEARAARYQGTVVLEVIVRKDGSCEVLRVVRNLGLKLDESAVEALKQWRFKPAMRNGEAVDVQLNVEVNFNLK